MKTRCFVLALLGLASSAFAADTISPNTKFAGPVTCTNTTSEITIEGGSVASAASTIVFSATLTFTLPTETPNYEDAIKESKLAIVADTTGELMVADGTTGNWKRSDFKVTAETPVQVKAVGTQSASGENLTFEVTFSADEMESKTVTVMAPQSGESFTTLVCEGEGSAKDMMLAVVSTDLLPATTGDDGSTKQDAELVARYAEWKSDESLGGALPEGLTTEQTQNAFAMNAPGVPSLSIIKIDTASGEVTLRGSVETTETDNTLPLPKINGVLSLSSAETLGGTWKTYLVTIESGSGELVRVPIPEGARFTKASVSLAKPENAGTISGTPEAE